MRRPKVHEPQFEARGVIGGVVVDEPRPTIPVLDPARPSVQVGVGVESSSEDVDSAVDSAVQAFCHWADLAPAQRGQHMLAGAAVIEDEVLNLAELLVSEVGKPAHDAYGDVRGGVHLLRTFADLAGQLADMRDLTGQPGAGTADEVLLQQVPVGPTVVITPWNTPIYLCLNAVAPALVSGCTVVVKPPEEAPLALTRALHLLASALPAGVLNVLPGRGATVGDRLIRHPQVRAVSLTGGIATGRAALTAAAEGIKKMHLELGGNDPAILLEDVDLGDDTLRELVAGCFSVSGQVCFNIKRIYVHQRRFDEFLERFTGFVDRLVVGRGSEPDVHLGPLTTEAGFVNAQRLIHRAQSAGHTVHIGGQWAGGSEPEEGRFVLPAVVTGMNPGDELVTEEQFAPIIPVVPFSSEAEAIAEANRTEYGLCSSVWSQDSERAKTVARQIQAGNTFINAHRVGASVPLVPFGGVKQSGLGRNHLFYAIAAFTEDHAIIRYSRPGNQIPGIEPWLGLESAATIH